MSKRHKHKRHHGHASPGAGPLPRAAGGGASGTTALAADHDWDHGARFAGFLPFAPGCEGGGEPEPMAFALPPGVTAVDLGLARVLVPEGAADGGAS